VGYLIDTDIWVRVERGALAPADVAIVTKTDPVFISPVTIAELQYGAEITSDASIRQKRLAALKRLKRKPLLRIDAETGEIFGSLAAQLSRGRGHDFRVQDLWLAAQAIQRAFRFLTYNEKDFRDIPGLDMVVMPKPS
jgi:predicted nucleic acid-binding protein